MKTEQRPLKKRIGKAIFCFLFIINFSKHPVFAEENTEDKAFAHLVYFQPRIYIAQKAEPCIGVRVSKKHVFTSPSCARHILALSTQTVDINVLSPDGVRLGHIQTSHHRSATAGLLSIDLYADNLLYQPPVIRCPRANDTYYFHCGERGIRNCSELVSPEGGAGIEVNGTCVNPESKEQCTFYSSYVFNSDEMDYERKLDFITCKSCSARYKWSNSSLTGGKFVICRPKGCMPDCKGKPEPTHSGKKTADSIGEGIAGEITAFALMGAIASVGYLVYKRCRRATYQSL